MEQSYRPSRRRSVPRLPDFSITPLRTHLEDVLGDEQGTHSYSQPQTPRSPRSTFHSPSHTPFARSRASSRDPSRTGGRRRKVKSALLLADLERPLAQIAASREDGPFPSKSKSSLRLHKVQTDVPAHPIKGHMSKSKSIGGVAITGNRSSSREGIGSDWLLSTASVLSMNTAESKGQSWLATKSASTSLAGTPYIEKDDFMFRPLTTTKEGDELMDSPETSRPTSRRNSVPASITGRSKSRRGSRAASRLGSRIGSRANLAALNRKTPADHGRADYFSNLGVDFADQGLDGDEEDSEDELDDFEEGELKKLVWGRVGGWVDWAVGWMDWRDGLEGLDDEDEEASDKPDQQRNQPVEGSKQKRKRRVTMKVNTEDDGIADTATDGTTINAPPEQASMAGDAKWLLGVVKKLIV